VSKMASNYPDRTGIKNSNWRGGGDKHKRYIKKHPEIHRFGGMRQRAKMNHVPFGLSFKTFIIWFSNTPKVCAYCGIELNPDMRIKTEKRDNLTIDRKYNEVGYVEGNLCIACGLCNMVKSNIFTYEEMKEIASKYIKPKRNLNGS
jgi:hypothetical protein